ncbi:methyl-accepting chemotaxis protein [Paenibacillus turicensis]|uniref:Methyl-accepting chemotaxis protein n=1 Tax=Paenibacillus turicensis TaxID=160487 RepID=A0ABS4FTW9_9BACL|nr:methyl-accepting chemotaxis protein [Paenibacillus turicensis]MBP1906026.1 methyl-accepting chemotaxis protein [Paenibacillus turicensis]
MKKVNKKKELKVPKTRLKFLTIKNKLMLSFIFILVVPTLTIGVIGYTSSKGKLSTELQEGAQNNVTMLNEVINNFFKGKAGEIDFMSKMFTAGDVTPVEDTNVGHDDFIRKHLNNYKEIHPEVELAFVGTDTGLYMNAPESQKNALDYDPRKRPWYQDTMEKKGEVYISSPYKSSTSGNVLVTVGKVTEDGRGVAAASVRIDQLAEMVKSVSIGDYGYAYIVDALGNIVYHPNLEAGAAATPDEQVERMSKKPADSFSFTASDGEVKNLVYQTSDTTGWKIVGTMYEREVGEHASSILRALVYVMITSLVIGGVLVIGIIISILKPMRKLQHASTVISEGDLTERVDFQGNDELGELSNSFNKMTESLHHVIEQVNQNVMQLAASSEELSSSADQSSTSSEYIALAIQKVSEGADQQSNAVQDTYQELNTMIQQLASVTTQADTVSDISNQTYDQAQQGNETAQAAVEQMNAVGEKVESLAEAIQGFKTRSNEIVEIIGFISSIARQTNLLALNASIEAARAGEHGKGFAVVATEIRHLAEQSNQSAAQITELVTAIEQEAEEAVEAMSLVSHEVKEGVGKVDETGVVFGQIQQAIRQVADQVSQVSEASKQMAAGANNVDNLMHHVHEVAEQSSSSIQDVVASTEEQLATMEEISASSTMLAKMAEDLQQVIIKFKM